MQHGPRRAATSRSTFGPTYQSMSWVPATSSRQRRQHGYRGRRFPHFGPLHGRQAPRLAVSGPLGARVGLSAALRGPSKPAGVPQGTPAPRPSGPAYRPLPHRRPSLISPFRLIQKSHHAILALTGSDRRPVAFCFRNGWLFSPEYASNHGTWNKIRLRMINSR